MLSKAVFPATVCKAAAEKKLMRLARIQLDLHQRFSLRIIALFHEKKEDLRVERQKRNVISKPAWDGIPKVGLVSCPVI